MSVLFSAATLLDHAQRIAPRALPDVHANTWRYNQLIAQQRAIIVERRNKLLATAAAARNCRRWPRSGRTNWPSGSPEQLDGSAGRSCCTTWTAAGPITWPTWPTSGRASTWCALGRQNPLDEFHRLAVDAFGSLASNAVEAAQQTFETADLVGRRRARIRSRPVEAGPPDVDMDVHGATIRCRTTHARC